MFVIVKLQQVFSVEPFIRESYAISWDNYGYYLHLPATLIYKDPGITGHWVDTLNNKYQKDRPFYQVWDGTNGRKVNVYPVGLAICNLPFFLGGHLFAKISGYAADGLSPPYQWAMILSALFYAILGMWLLRKLLLKFFSDHITSIVLVLIAAGTNLYYYATYNDLLPHIHLFAVDCGILLLTIRWHEKPTPKTALFIGALTGLATITRPSEIVWILVPLLWNISGWATLKEKFRMLGSNFTHVVLFMFGMIAVGSLQLFYWKYTSGNWFSFNHTEGFDFFCPFTWKVLFSYKKGWLVYTPMMAIAIAGLLLSWKSKREVFIPFLIFFLANLWFISSWECWWYAGSFGQRAFVQSYGLMAIPLGFFIEMIFVKKVVRIVGSLVLVFFAWLNLFQVWQLNNDILSDQFMTKEYYWKIFGRTEIDPEWRNLLEMDPGNVEPLPPDDGIFEYQTRELFSLNADRAPKENPRSVIKGVTGIDSLVALEMNADHPFAAIFDKPYDSITTADHVRLRFSTLIYCNGDSADRSLNFVMNINGRRGQAYGYTAIQVTIPSKEKGWREVRADFVTPVILHETDVVHMYLWDNTGIPIDIDFVNITAFEPK